MRSCDPWYRFFGSFNPAWLVDPPDYVVDPEQVGHAWQVAIGGAVPGDQVELGGPAGEQLAVATVDETGTALLGHWSGLLPAVLLLRWLPASPARR
jgi:hypothetical protein